MTQLLISCLLWFAAVGCGLLAGVYFAFSTFIMTALGRIEQAQGVSAMNSISSTILHSLFMPFFYGTTLASLVLLVIGFIRRGEPGAIPLVAGGLIYVAGMSHPTSQVPSTLLPLRPNKTRRQRYFQ